MLEEYSPFGGWKGVRDTESGGYGTITIMKLNVGYRINASGQNGLVLSAEGPESRLLSPGAK